MADSTPQLTVFPNPRVRYTVMREDPAFVVVHKPAGVVTQPGRKHTRDTLLNGLFARYGKRLQNLGKARDFGLVHRLDRPTSGLVIVALTREAYDSLRGQFAERQVDKTYLAVVHGQLRPPVGTERAPIAERRVDGRKRAVLGGRRAQPAVTRFEAVAHSKVASLVVCRPATGRLHQIRVHLNHRGCPVVGDGEYGRRTPLDRGLGKRRIALHAAALRVRHPVTGKAIETRSPLPDALKALLDQVGLACPRAWR